MNYWITTHWPQLDDYQGELPSGVYLQEGTQEVGEDIMPGDLLIMDESQSGKSEVWIDTACNREIHHRSRGRYGIVCLCEIVSPNLYQVYGLSNDLLP